MGPTGSGKTTIGRALAAELGWRFVEGDVHHPPANIEKMSAGQPLSDAEREPWLASLRAAIVRAIDRREHTVVACSALRERYRRALAGGLRGVRFVYLHVPREVLLERASGRPEHFAGPALVASQLAALEEPVDAVRLDATAPPEAILGTIRHELGI